MKLPRVQRVRKGDKIYKYHRTTGARLPVDVPEDHPAFIAAWSAEESRKPAPKMPDQAGSIGAACVAYMASEEFLALSPDYRRIIKRGVEAIRDNYGTAPFARIETKHINADVNKLTPHPANQRRKAWRNLCKWAKLANLIPTDPSIASEGKRAPKSDGHPAWTAEEVEAFRAHWPIDHPRRLAFEVLHWTGARISDGCRLHRRMVVNGLLTFNQDKTGGLTHVPWTCQLPPFADRASHRFLMQSLDAVKPDLLFIERQGGGPRTKKGLGNWIAESARLAGVNKSAHGLRKTRLSDLAERGAPALAIMSWGGHQTLSEVQHYIQSAERRRIVRGVEQEQNPVNHSDPSRKKS